MYLGYVWLWLVVGGGFMNFGVGCWVGIVCDSGGKK